MRPITLFFCALLLPTACSPLTKEQSASLKAARTHYDAAAPTLTRRQALKQFGQPSATKNGDTLSWETSVDRANFERFTGKFGRNGRADTLVWLSSRGDARGLYQHQKLEAAKSTQGRSPYRWKQTLVWRLACPVNAEPLTDEDQFLP